MINVRIAYSPHRRNRDGSYDSICLNCFATIAAGKSEAELWRHDKMHVCVPATLSQRAFDSARRANFQVPKTSLFE
jgi:hypothetical protein